MKLIQASVITLCSIAVISCGNKAKYGADFDAAQAVPVEKALADFQNSGKADNIIKGEILKVCQTEGCWFTYKLADGDLFVDFEHKFEIPKNASGRQIAASGNFYRDTTTVDQLKEYAKDDGKSEAEIAAITEPEIRVEFVAKGVQFIESK